MLLILVKAELPSEPKDSFRCRISVLFALGHFFAADRAFGRYGKRSIVVLNDEFGLGGHAASLRPNPETQNIDI
jgi:hypothetical protein